MPVTCTVNWNLLLAISRNCSREWNGNTEATEWKIKVRKREWRAYSKHIHANWLMDWFWLDFLFIKRHCISFRWRNSAIVYGFATSGLFAKNCTFVDIPSHKFIVYTELAERLKRSQTATKLIGCISFDAKSVCLEGKRSHVNMRDGV